MDSLTLVTFTYNDARLADGLLDHLRSFSVRPDRVIVTDDGSAVPYRPVDPPPGTSVLRLPRNLGITRAKHAGVSAATTQTILSLDCDVRLAPDWLELCLPHLKRPGIGAVCGPVAHAPGGDSVARFLRAFGDNHNLAADGPVDFIPGNAYLIRREVWEKTGGFSGHGRNVCEDHYLSARIKDLGLTLYCERRAKSLQVRRISRLAMVKRFWKWCHAPVKAALPGPHAFPDFFHLTFAQPLLDRLGTAAEIGEPLFIYLEILYLSHIVLDLLAHGRDNLDYPADLERIWTGEMARLFTGHPRLFALLRADLAGLGQFRPGARELPSPSAFASTLEVLAALGPTGVFDWLEAHGVDILLAEEKSGERDFSFYQDQDHQTGEGRAGEAA